MDKKTLKLNSKRHLTKENKNIICSRVQENTHDNLCKAIRALNFIQDDEFYYNYELSKITNDMKDKLVDILFEVEKEVNKHKSIFDN